MGNVLLWNSLENASSETDYNNNSILDGTEFWQTVFGVNAVAIPSLINSDIYF